MVQFAFLGTGSPGTASLPTSPAAYLALQEHVIREDARSLSLRQCAVMEVALATLKVQRYGGLWARTRLPGTPGSGAERSLGAVQSPLYVQAGFILSALC